MTTYRIFNSASGVDLGTYEAATAAEALDAMARDAGYADYAACCEAVPAGKDDLKVVEVE